MEIVDVSPVRSRTTITIDRNHQSVSGVALCVAMSADGNRLYLGGHSGVWRSDDGGQTWVHPERPAPPPGSTDVPGALLPPAVYDLLIAPSNPDVVLAATGRDSRKSSQNGIYRSSDAGNSWQRVHMFVNASGTVGTVASLAVAPDDPSVMFAGSQFGIAVSTDGGQTWANRMPQTLASQSAWYVACGPTSTAGRRVFAVGTRVWSSRDSGQTWVEDAVDIPEGSPADAVPGPCARCICVDPTDSNVLYVARDSSQLWRGRFPDAGPGPAEWRELPTPPRGFPETTASGADFIVVHEAPGGRRLLIFSDRATVHVTEDVPTGAGDWDRIDTSPVHVDPRGIAVTPSFRWRGAGGGSGRIVLVNDGGAVVSDDGAGSWKFGAGPSTLGLVNTAVLPRPGEEPGLVIQMGHNNGFFSADGGRHWRTQDYRGGDNDCSFADTRQPERLIVFAPRHNPGAIDQRAIYLYATGQGEIPDGSWDTEDRQTIPGPPPPPGEVKSQWNAVSNFYDLGYRPLVLTLDGEDPRRDGDFVTIVVSDDKATARLLRTTAMSSITSASDWLSTATDPSSGAKVIQQGPLLPNPNMSVVQPSGGHTSPTFYVGDQDEGRSQGLWRWRHPQTNWQPVVPHTGSPGPQRARRFFVDPYRPEILYVLDTNRVWQTDDGGTTWAVDSPLEQALTQAGAFPINMTAEAGSAQVLLRDMAFDASARRWRVAVGPAGVFVTYDGQSWTHLLHSAAAGLRPNNVAVDDMSDRAARTVYVSTSNRGLLRLGPLGIALDPPLMNFGSVKVGEVARRTLTLQNRSGVRLDISVPAPAHGVFQWAEFSAILDDGEQRQMEVQFRPASNAIERGRLLVRSLAPGSPQSVGLIGKGPGGFPPPPPPPPPPPVLKVTPTTISFGSLPLGTVATRAVTIENATGATVNLSIAGPPAGSRFSWDAFTGSLLNGAKHVVNVTFGPVVRGVAAGSLIVVSDTPESPHRVSLAGKSIGGF